MTFGRLVAFGLIVALSLPAQTITGSITGTVSDQSSLPVQGATVVLTNQATGAKREAETDARADFLFSGLPPGQYSLSVLRRVSKLWNVLELYYPPPSGSLSATSSSLSAK